MNHLFWLSTLIPGFAILQAARPVDLRYGLLATIAWSFGLTVALASPIIVVAHVLELTAPTVAFLYLGLVALGLAGIVKFSRAAHIRKAMRVARWPELAVVLAVIGAGAYLGGVAHFDSWVYAAKIRYLMDVGFSLQDPYSPLPVFESRYLVNTYLGLHAIGAWLSDTEPIEMLFESAWFFRLLALGGIEFLAMVLFRSRWVAMTCVFGALFFIGAESAGAYPKYVAGYVVFPILMAQILQVLDRRAGSRYFEIAAASLALALIHIGFWSIAILCMAPTFLGWYLWRIRLSTSGMPAVLAGTALLLPGLPFAAMTALQPAPHWELWDSWFTFSLYTFNTGGSWTLYMLNPVPYFWMVPTSAVIVLLLLSVPEPTRRRVVFLGSILMAALLYMFNPFFLTVLMKRIPYWIVERAHFIGLVTALVVIPGWLALMARDALRTRVSRVVFSFALISGSMFLFKPAISSFYNNRSTHQYMLQRARELQEVVETITDERPLIAADPTLSLLLPAVRISAVMAPYLTHSNPADEGTLRRHNDAQELLALTTSEARRREIISEHGIDYVLIGPHRGRSGTDDEVDMSMFHEFEDLVIERHGFQLFRLPR